MAAELGSCKPLLPISVSDHERVAPNTPTGLQPYLDAFHEKHPPKR